MADNPVEVENSSDEKIWALLSYIFPVIVPILILVMEDKKNVPFLKYHAITSLMLSVLETLLGFVLIGLCLSPLLYLYGIYIGIMAYQGKQVEVPVLTDFAKGQGWI